MSNKTLTISHSCLTNSNKYIDTNQDHYNDVNLQDAHCTILPSSDLISLLCGSPIYDAYITQPITLNIFDIIEYKIEKN